MDGAGPNVFERIEHKLSSIGIQVDNSDLRGAEKQIEASLEKNPADMESKLTRLELKVIELARFLDAALTALETHNGDEHVPESHMQAQISAQPKQGVRKIKKLQQNAATGVIEEVEVDDNPADHFIVADGHGRYTGNSMDPKKDGKKSVFIAAADDEAVSQSDKKMRK